jgi:NhaP-type Na+/H+ and K+/H+ antiporter
VDVGVADRTLAGHLQSVFRARPVVGDRARIDAVELVVREIRDRRIAKVGLRFISPNP